MSFNDSTLSEAAANLFNFCVGLPKFQFYIYFRSFRSDFLSVFHGEDTVPPQELRTGCKFQCQAAARRALCSNLSAGWTTFAVWMPKKIYRISGRVSRLDLIPVSFSSFPFLREDITLQSSRQDVVVGTVTNQKNATNGNTHQIKSNPHWDAIISNMSLKTCC